MTEEGVVLGTPTYMSPEQARGKPVDRRTDIWALGCVLYECLTGARAFSGDSTTDILAAIVQAEPDWSRLPALPGRVSELLRRALTKDPRQRLRDAGEARVQLQLARDGSAESGADTGAPASSDPEAGRRVWSNPWAIVLVAAGALGAGYALRSPSTPGSVRPAAGRHLRVVFERAQGEVQDLAISPDGTHLAWTQFDGLYVRRLDSLEARAVTLDEATEPGDYPRNIAWSPDSQKIAFTAGEALWHVSREGEHVSLVARGGILPDSHAQLAWTPQGQLVYSDGASSTLQGRSFLVNETTPIVSADPQETLHFDGVSVLPGGDLLVVRHGVGPIDPDTIALWRGGELRDVLRLTGWNISGPCHAQGRLVFERKDGGTESIWSVAFDLEAGEVLGEPTLVAEGCTNVSIAIDGTLAYVSLTGQTLSESIWVDLQGRIEPFGRASQAQALISVASHDGRQVFTSNPAEGGTVWAYDLERGVSTPAVQLERGSVVWAGSLPDGRILASSWIDQQTVALPNDGRSQPEVITAGMLGCISRDGAWGLVLRGPMSGEPSVDLVDLKAGGEPIPLREGAGMGPADLSPDKRWLLFGSERTGRAELYLTSLRGGSRDWPVSTDGGLTGWFDESGETIYYWRGERFGGRRIEVWKVSFQSEPEVRLGAPQKLFDLEGDEVMLTDFHVTEGRFLGARRVRSSDNQIVLETGWMRSAGR